VVAPNVTGNLAASGFNFTVSLTGFNEVKGSVLRLDIYSRAIPEWNLEGDVAGQGTVDLYDLVAIAHHVGETPGCGQGLYSLQQVEQYDVNFDCQVNIYSLVTVASEIGS
jgi:hypothetical protein